MHKLVYTCFKTIALTMLFIIAWDLGFYLFRVNTLNNRYESIMVYVQEVVSKNNYLPQQEHDMFKAMFNEVNGNFNSDDNKFVVDPWMNYSAEAVFDSNKPVINVNGKNIVRYTLNKVGNYGDVMVVQARVKVKAPVWGFTGSRTSAENLNRKGYRHLYLNYTYLVPCLKYNTSN